MGIGVLNMSTLKGINVLSSRAERQVEQFCQRRYWKWELAFCCVLLVFFVAFPYIDFISDADHKFTTWSVVKKQIESPLTALEFSDSESHYAKRTFRLAVPVLFKLFDVHNVWLMYTFQLGVTILFFWIVASMSESITQSRVLAFTLTLSFAFVYMGQSGVTDVFAKFDVYAITCMLAAMYFRKAILTFLFLTFAVWTDERAAVGCGLVYVFFKIEEEGLEGLKLWNWIKPGWNSYAVVAALLSYLMLRLGLIQYFDFKTVLGDIGWTYFLRQMNMLLFGIWSAFEGFWLLILVSLISLWQKKIYGVLIPLIFLVSIQMTTSFFVVDITRSLIYMAPLVFIAMHIAAQYESDHDLRILGTLTLLICVLVPTYFAEGGFRIEGSNPFLIKLISWIV
jgi:hypothetical protein